MSFFGKFKSLNDKIVNRDCLLQITKDQKRGKEKGTYSRSEFEVLE